MRFFRYLFLSIILLITNSTFAQDVNLYLSDHYLAAKSIIKLSRDFDDPYLWILAPNNGIFRLNTATKQLEDLSASFQQFSSYQIFDIAGITYNTLTFAIRNAGGTVLVTYDNGNITYPFIGNPYALDVYGNITGIGPSSIYTEQVYGYADHPALLVATDQGFYRYSYQTTVIQPNGDIPSQLYSSTYRNNMFKLRDEVDTSGTNLVPALFTSPGRYNHYDGVIRQGSKYGGNINTAYATTNEVFDSPPYYTPDVFWGNEKGLYQSKFRNTHPFLSSARHYLDNIKVNKICDIFGLIAFGNQVAKENLLIGTDNGLYYSNSFLHAGMDTALDKITLYHYDKLGNIPINYVEVNNAGTSLPPFCENGIWVATNDGLYLIKPDYAANINPGKLVRSIHFDGQDTSIMHTHICSGSTTIATLNDDVTANSIQWFKDGNEIINQNGNSLPITTAGNY